MMATFTPPGPLQTAVLFLVFNRPDTTAQVFEAIRQAKPPRLYVAADGPREGRQGEAQRVAKVREIATAVDWPCEITTLFRENNLGCKYAVAGAISWFFENEEQGIILEDDCLPNKDFFSYCEWGLAEFKESKQVWHINGNNFGVGRDVFRGEDVGFSALAQVWGWASWADRWSHYQINPFYLTKEAVNKLSRWKLSRQAKTRKLEHLAALKGGLDTWDYQWQVAILNAGGLVLSPSSNLVSNLGDGPDATHTKFDNKRIRLPTEELKSFRYSSIEANTAITEWYELKMGLKRRMPGIKRLPGNFWRSIKKTIKRFYGRVFFRKITRIVIASTGRAGSTMLCNAIRDSLIDHEVGRLPLVVRTILKRASIGYIDRLSDFANVYAPVLKTHDLYDRRSEINAKIVFVYGDPLEAAQSVEGQARERGLIWVEEHIYHLAGHGKPDEIFTKDVLNYEAQIKNWSKAEGVFLVNYDDLWVKNDELNRYLGFNVQLPNRRERTKKLAPDEYNEDLFGRLKKLENDLRLQSA